MNKQFRKIPIECYRSRFDINSLMDRPRQHIRFISPSKNDSCGFVDNDTVNDNRYERDILISEDDIVPGSVENDYNMYMKSRGLPIPKAPLNCKMNTPVNYATDTKASYESEQDGMQMMVKRSETKSRRKKKNKKKKKKKKKKKNAIIKNEILRDQKRENVFKTVPFNARSMPLLEISEEENIFPDLQEEEVTNNDGTGSKDLWEVSEVTELSEYPQDDYEMFADEIVVNDDLNLETEKLANDEKKKYITKTVSSPNNEYTSNDYMLNTCRRRMSVKQKLMMGLKINTPFKFCPFCPYITLYNLKSHIIRKHGYIMKEPIENNTKQLLSNSSKNHKLIPLNTVRDIVGHNLWQDPKIRETLHTLLKMLQVELWLGSWELPNVPFVNHVAPYVKASYMNYWCNNIKREEIDRIPNVPNYFGSLIERLWGAGLQKQLTKDHPLISLYRNVYWMTHPYQPKAIKRYLATASRVLRYVQDKCIQNEIPVHHWLVLLQQPDYIIEYLRLREKLGQATRTTINYLQVLKPLLFHAMTSFPYDDPTFPIVDGVPDHRVIDGFKYTLDQLLKAFPEIKKK